MHTASGSKSFEVVWTREAYELLSAKNVRVGMEGRSRALHEGAGRTQKGFSARSLELRDANIKCSVEYNKMKRDTKRSAGWSSINYQQY